MNFSPKILNFRKFWKIYKIFILKILRFKFLKIWSQSGRRRRPETKTAPRNFFAIFARNPRARKWFDREGSLALWQHGSVLAFLCRRRKPPVSSVHGIVVNFENFNFCEILQKNLKIKNFPKNFKNEMFSVFPVRQGSNLASPNLTRIPVKFLPICEKWSKSHFSRLWPLTGRIFATLWKIADRVLNFYRF